MFLVATFSLHYWGQNYSNMSKSVAAVAICQYTENSVGQLTSIDLVLAKGKTKVN